MALGNLIDRLYQLVLAIRTDVKALKAAYPTKDCLSVYLGTAANSTTAGWQKVPLDTVSFDTGGIWVAATKRVVPKKAGKYSVTVRARTGTASAIGAVAVRLNGATAAKVGAEGALTGGGGSCLVHCNGTTDYIELYAYLTTVRAYTTGSADNYLHVVGPF